MATGKLKINIEATEQQIAENCINLSHSGNKNYATIVLSLTALAEGWSKDKLFHYLKEAGIKNE